MSENAPNLQTIEQQAADWLVKLDQTEQLSDSDKQAFSVWYQANQQHQQTLLQMSEIWAALAPVQTKINTR
ncbi:putative regulator of iron dicitrate transport [Catenovulum agarivorans DS-2]|uniref:Putative regulator of iron dicitrate transport n=1 Tax=Catenovulum agarivorans DS-2 TaxID=1328313 RepID=W7QMS8_9ALTE|nr:DUF4880 domain-containing protein [Catenovulum agarivorans]EWH09223.1 putative regulator of iron dicitrate transport [Catenovulum agarivorans DS-2]